AALDVRLGVVTRGEVGAEVHSHPARDLDVEVEVRRRQREVGREFDEAVGVVGLGEALELDGEIASDVHLHAIEGRAGLFGGLERVEAGLARRPEVLQIRLEELHVLSEGCKREQRQSEGGEQERKASHRSASRVRWGGWAAEAAVQWVAEATRSKRTTMSSWARTRPRRPVGGSMPKSVMRRAWRPWMRTRPSARRCPRAVTVTGRCSPASVIVPHTRTGVHSERPSEARSSARRSAKRTAG